MRRLPKILDQPKEKMTEAAREILLNEGYQALTIRRIASVCNTGVGTVYNYFSSKDSIAAAVMLRDWKSITDELVRSLDHLNGIDGIEAIFMTVRKFSLIYSKVWAEYDDKGRPTFGFWTHPMKVNGIEIPAKSPAEMFEEDFIPNSLQLVLDKMKEYYGE